MGQSDQRFPPGSDELQRFHRDGYIGPFDLYDPASLSSYYWHIEIEFLPRHITRPEIIDRVASILAPDVIVPSAAEH